MPYHLNMYHISGLPRRYQVIGHNLPPEPDLYVGDLGLPIVQHRLCRLSVLQGFGLLLAQALARDSAHLVTDVRGVHQPGQLCLRPPQPITRHHLAWLRHDCLSLSLRAATAVWTQ